MLLQDAWASDMDESEAVQREKDIDKHLEAIRTHDPKNAHGVLEQAVFGEAVRTLQSIPRTATKEEAGKKVLQAQTMLESLVKDAKELKNGQPIYTYLAQTYLFEDKKDKGIETLEKALEADPDSPMADRLEKIIAQLKGA